MLALHVTDPALAFGRQLHPANYKGETTDEDPSFRIDRCCLGLAAAGVAAQSKDAMKKEMTAAECKTYMDAAPKTPK